MTRVIREFMAYAFWFNADSNESHLYVNPNSSPNLDQSYGWSWRRTPESYYIMTAFSL